jgi:subtilisin family serine protease
MRRLVSVAAVIASLAASLPAVAQSDEMEGRRLGLARHEYFPHSVSSVLVEIDPQASVASAVGSGAKPLGGRWFEVPIPRGRTAVEWMTEVSSRAGVRTSELNLLLEFQSTAPLSANDPLYTGGTGPSHQWHHHSIDLAGVWQATTGTGVRVAVIDSGVTAGSDGFCLPFADEYDAVNQRSGSGAGADRDPDRHGSHVAGSIAQCTGNGRGGVGVAPGATIMPISVYSSGGAEVGAVVRALDWARSRGAKVANLSLGCSGCRSSALDDAIVRASNAGIVIVAAAGNDPVDVFYPANHPSVIAVGATTYGDGVASYSARGPDLEIAAPGGDRSAPVWQEAGTGYVGFVGTSMASPHVAGAAALLRAAHPGASAAQVRAALRCGAKDLGPAGRDDFSGAGLLQVRASLERLGTMVAAGTTGCGSPGVGPVSAGWADRPVLHDGSKGLWWLYRPDGSVFSLGYGNAGDVPFFGDWDCDGVDTPGLYRRSTGFVYLRNSNTTGVADRTFFFGDVGDVPVAGDFNGDGCDTVSIYRPSEARFYIVNRLGANGGGLGFADYSFPYGNLGDVPFARCTRPGRW